MDPIRRVVSGLREKMAHSSATDDSTIRKSDSLTTEEKVSRMNEHNGTSLKYVEGRCYDDPAAVGGAFQKSGLGAGFHGVLIDYINTYKTKDAKKIVLVAESKEAANDLKAAFPWAEISNLVDYSDKDTGSDYDVDLNLKQNFNSNYDVVLSQALLEHVSNPFMAVENFVDLLKKDGIIVLHTHNCKMPYHGYPIDCVRFQKDWFEDLPKYLPVEMVDFLEADVHMFCVYRRVE